MFFGVFVDSFSGSKMRVDVGEGGGGGGGGLRYSHSNLRCVALDFPAAVDGGD